jgi:GNS1/SUR4 family
LGAVNLVKGCDFPDWMKYTLMVYMVSFIVLFGRFYVTAYYNGHKRRRAEHKAKTPLQCSDPNSHLEYKVE